MRSRSMRSFDILYKKLVMIFAAGLIFSGFIPVAVYADDSIADSINSNVWQDDNTTANVSAYSVGNSITVSIDSSRSEVYEDYAVINAVFDNTFSVKKEDAIVFEYDYSGSESIGVRPKIDDISGNAISFDNGIDYAEIKDSCEYISHSDNGLISLEPGSKGKVLILLNDDKNVNDQIYYGMDFTLVFGKNEKAKLKMSDFCTASGNNVELCRKYCGTAITGEDTVKAPYLGEYWYDYSISGNKADMKIQPEVFEKGVSVNEAGRLSINDNVKPISIMIKSGVDKNAYIVKKVDIISADEALYKFSAPDKAGTISYPLMQLSGKNTAEICFRVLAVLAVLIFIISIIINIRVDINTDKSEKEKY